MSPARRMVFRALFVSNFGFAILATAAFGKSGAFEDFLSILITATAAGICIHILDRNPQ